MQMSMTDKNRRLIFGANNLLFKEEINISRLTDKLSTYSLESEIKLSKK